MTATQTKIIQIYDQYGQDALDLIADRTKAAETVARFFTRTKNFPISASTVKLYRRDLAAEQDDK